MHHTSCSVHLTPHMPHPPSGLACTYLLSSCTTTAAAWHVQLPGYGAPHACEQQARTPGPPQPATQCHLKIQSFPENASYPCRRYFSGGRGCPRAFFREPCRYGWSCVRRALGGGSRGMPHTPHLQHTLHRLQQSDPLRQPGAPILTSRGCLAQGSAWAAA